MVFLNIIAAESCVHPEGTKIKQISCCCLSFLQREEFKLELDVVEKYMLSFTRMKVEYQKDQINDWARMAGILNNIVQDRLSYPLPSLGLYTSRCRQLICCLAVHCIPNISKANWETITRNETRYFQHGLLKKQGIDSNKLKSFSKVHQSLHSFSKELNEEGVPFAMNAVRKEIGL